MSIRTSVNGEFRIEQWQNLLRKNTSNLPMIARSVGGASFGFVRVPSSQFLIGLIFFRVPEPASRTGENEGFVRTTIWGFSDACPLGMPE